MGLKRIIMLAFLLQVFFLTSYSQWTQSTGLTGCTVWDIDIKDTMLFIATSDGDGIFRKGINQNSWENSFTHNGAEEFVVLDSCVIANIWGDLYRTCDLGDTWEFFPTPYWQGVYSVSGMSGSLFMTSYSGADSAYHSDDYGNSWTNISPEFNFHNFPKIWAYDGFVYTGSGHYADSLIFESSDNGTTWNTLSYNGLPLCDDGFGHILRFQDMPWAGGRGGVFLFTGSEWIPKNDGLPEDIRITELKVIDSILYCVSSKGYFLYNGTTWVDLNEGLSTHSATGIVGYNDILYCGDARGPYIRFTGESWQPIHESLEFLEILDIDDKQDSICACTNKGLYMSYDFGLNFSQKTADSLTECRHVVMTDSLYYMLLYQYGFFVSYDKGETWLERNQGLNAQYYSKIGLNDDYVFLVGGDGLYRSPHGEQTWGKLLDTLGTGNYADINVIGNKILILDTQGKLYLSEDGGIYFVEVLDSVNHIDYAENKYYSCGDYLLNYSSDGIIWNNTPIGGYGISVDARLSTILVGGVMPYISEHFLSMSFDYGQSWDNILDNLGTGYGYSKINHTEIMGNRVFACPTHLSLWYRDDLITTILQHSFPEEEVNIYPNPAKDHVNITFTPHFGDRLNLSLYDLHGRIIQSNHKVIGEGSIKLSIKDIPAGVYILQLNNEEYHNTVKLIKQ